MDFTLGSRAAGAGYRLVALDSVGSTSSEALERAAAGEAGPLWITARRQTAGRGRRGRGWHSPQGNLAASLLITLDAAPAQIANLGFVAGLAAHDALASLLPPDARLALKWPNDVLAGGAKLAGILLESSPLPDGRSALVVGFGINVVAAPEGLPYATASLRGLGSQAGAEAVLEALSDCWCSAFEDWAGGTGFAATRTRWLECAYGLGGEIAVRHGAEELRGAFETIDADGRLVLRTGSGPRTIAAGEVHFGTAASAAAGI